MEGMCHSSKPDSREFAKPEAGFVRREVLHGRLWTMGACSHSCCPDSCYGRTDDEWKRGETKGFPRLLRLPHWSRATRKAFV